MRIGADRKEECTNQPSAISRAWHSALSVLYRPIYTRISARQSIRLPAYLYLDGWTAALLRQVARAAVRVVLHLLASCADRDGAVRLAVRCRHSPSTRTFPPGRNANLATDVR